MKLNAEVKKHKDDGFVIELNHNHQITFGDTFLDVNEMAFYVIEVSENIIQIVSGDSRFEKFPVPPFQVYKSALSK